MTTAEPQRAGAHQASVLPPGAYRELVSKPQPEPGRALKWLDPRTLWISRNDVLAKVAGDPVFDARRAWMARAASGGAAADRDLTVTRHRGERARFVVLGDTGEGDNSQFAVVPMLRRLYGESDFLFILSDVIYPAGDASDYPRKFYDAYGDFPGPIYAVPGNHDWYDLLHGFMFHLCGAEGLPPSVIPKTPPLWRRTRAPDATGRSLRDERHGVHPPQPAPYFAIEAGPLLLVAIDTGITNGLDRDQGAWLRAISKRPGPKILLTGKPLVVNDEARPCEIEDGGDVDEIVRDAAHGYVAAIGGDIHKYQRYPVRLEDGRTLQYIVSGGGGAYMAATHTIRDITLPGVEEHSEHGDHFRCYPTRSQSLVFYSRTVPHGLRGLALVCLAGSGLATGAFALDELPRRVAWLRWALAGIVAAGWSYFVGMGGLWTLLAYRKGPIPIDDARLIMKECHPGSNLVVAPPATKEKASLRSRLLARSLFRTHGGGRSVTHSFFSEIYDTDTPNFHKSFLSFDVDADRVVITCHPVTGAEDEDSPLLVEDRVEIPLRG